MVVRGLWVSTLALCLLTGTASALPNVGSPAPSGKVVDADGNPLDIGQIKGRPVLIVYEDQEATKQNLELKRELSALAKGDAYRDAIALVAVADVQGYDYWPARGFVKSAIRKESKKLGTTIYCDWKGALRQSAGFHKGQSTVILLSADSKVLFAHEGSMPAATRTRLIELISAQVAAK